MSEDTIYFLETPSDSQRQLLCRWVERFYEEGKRIQVLAGSSMAAQQLDQLLWTFSQSSFIPHRILTTGATASVPEPVLITVGEVFLEQCQVLVCDALAGIEFMERYPLSIHFVLRDDLDRRQESRLLWQTARDRQMHVRHIPHSDG
jgi:DNA polymerase-3 subunit chi